MMVAMIPPATESIAMPIRVAVLLVAGIVVGACSLSGLDEQYGPSGAIMGCGGPENCTNGIDDNCDGLVDCADPQCTQMGFACTASAIPAGWLLVSFSTSARPVCPVAWGAEAQVVSNVAGAPGTCACTCSGGPATCVGTATYNGYPNACSTGAAPVNLAVNDGACAATTASITSGNSYQLYFASTAQPHQATCTGSGTVTAAPPPTFDAGATCAAPSMLGTGCAVGVCAPPSAAPFKTCISHPGTVACPAFGYTAQVLASTGTPGYVDARACGACSCASSITCGAVSKVVLFTNATCAGGAADAIDTGCQLVGSSASIRSYKVEYASGGDDACKPKSSSPPTGSVVLDGNVKTICCAP
jgi:hypothetical protein